MMGFLLPASLLALAFVAGPIVAHLVRRRGVDVQQLPTVRFLHAAVSASSRRRRIVDVLLLALRVAAFVALALAAAQPFRPLPASSVGTTAVSATFVVDDSHSMRALRDGETLSAHALRRALEDLRSLPPGSYASVIAAGAPPRVLARRARAPEVAEAALRSLERGSARGGALVEALELTHGTFEPGLERHLFVYSDFAAHEAAEGASLPRDARAHLVRLRPDRTVNHRVVEARFIPGDSEAAQASIEVRVQSDAGERGRFTVGVFDGPEQLGRAEGAFDEGGRGQLTLALDEAPPGDALEVRLLGAGDALTADDARPVLTRAGGHTRVVVVDGKPRPRLLDSASGFFRAALTNAPARSGSFSVRAVDEAALDERLVSEADVLVFADVHAPSPERFDRVLRSVERGAGLLIALGASSDPFAYTGLLGARAPGRLLAATTGERGGATSEVLSHDPGNLRVTQHFAIEPHGDSRVLLSLSGTPIAAERRYGSGTIALLGIPLDDSLSNFPYLPAYLPTMVELLSRLAPPRLAETEIVAGTTVSLEAFFRERDSIVVETPDGERITVTRDAPELEATGEPGVYRVLDVGGEGAAFAAVFPLEETSLAEGALPEPPPLEGEAATQISARLDLTPWLAALGALLLALEGFVRTRAARQPRTDSTTRGVPPRSGSARVAS